MRLGYWAHPTQKRADRELFSFVGNGWPCHENQIRTGATVVDHPPIIDYHSSLSAAKCRTSSATAILGSDELALTGPCFGWGLISSAALLGLVVVVVASVMMIGDGENIGWVVGSYPEVWQN